MASQNFGTISVNNIIFLDSDNVPIAPNQVLTTRGDGGIFFTQLYSNGVHSIPFGAFSRVVAPDSLNPPNNIVIDGSNAFNTLSFDAGAGIEFIHGIDPYNPSLRIQSIAPEQIVVGDDVVDFKTLSNDPNHGGRALYFAGRNDIVVTVENKISPTFILP